MKNNSKTVTYGSLFFNSQLMSDIKENLLKKGFIFETFAQTSDHLSPPISNSTKNWNWC
ncbi:hypothetical protein ACF3NV_02420 [Moraxella atlantae]|uniref:hypothetical protein n=1 Tax=Faucicola atlantae TaxID=34059 RepID=UPI00374FE5D3